MPECNPALREIIGGHLDRYSIPLQNTDAVLLHPSAGIGQGFVLIVELYAITRIGENFQHETLKLKQFFLSH